MISEKLTDRLNADAMRRMAGKVRQGRRRALLTISRCCVVVTDDGRETRELIFDEPPTIGQLTERVGQDVWVLSVQMRRVPRTARLRRAVAAE
ncbi:hypothetical protein [Acidimangrovimonas sediminis]|uniref:hypothetical protein n=1 Tax=Acidimangrovimonas sediminis TaxID=2056283 RepID=UPI0011AEC5C4|nr:hypothetical protein [Acidimangrovimonas sediminis]